MRTLEEYFTHVYHFVQSLPHVQAERYEEQILSATRGNLRTRLRFADQALLEMSEAVVLMAEELRWLSYRYQDSSGAMLFRYDSTPHHPEIPTHPDHKHIRDRIVASVHPSIEQVLQEVRMLRSRARDQ